MNAGDAYRTAQILNTHGLTPDAATRADLDTAADLAGATRPATSHDQHTVRLALDAIQEQQ